MQGQLKVSKDTVLDIEQYCSEKGVSRKIRLKELGISEGSYYYTKSLLREEGQLRGTFIRLSTGNVVQSRQSSRTKNEHPSSESVTIEIRTSSGTEMRIVGNMSPDILKTIMCNV